MEKKFSVEVGGRPLVFATGKVAKQANGAVVASHGETTILATACITDKPRTGIDFFPFLLISRRDSTRREKFPAASSSVRGALPKPPF